MSQKRTRHFSIVIVIAVAMYCFGAECAEPNGVPAGTILPFAGVNIPNGYLLCDGRLLDGGDAKYKELYAALETTYGPGIDSDGNPVLTDKERSLFPSGGRMHLFRLPDLQDRYLQGSGSKMPGEMGGAAEHILSQREMPKHNHVYLDIYLTPHGHNHFLKWPATDDDPNFPPVPTAGPLPTWGTSEHKPPHARGFQLRRTDGMEDSGDSQAHNNLPPYLVVNYIIKY